MENTEYYRKWYHSFEYCSSCFAKNDKHDMNCLECCPVQRGKQPDTLYENQEELLEKRNNLLKGLLYGM